MSELYVGLMSVQRSLERREVRLLCVCVCVGGWGYVHIGADCTVPRRTKVGLLWTNTIYSDLCIDSWGQGYRQGWTMSWTIDPSTIFLCLSFLSMPTHLASPFYIVPFVIKIQSSFGLKMLLLCVPERSDALPTVSSANTSESHRGPNPAGNSISIWKTVCVCVCVCVCACVCVL